MALVSSGSRNGANYVDRLRMQCFINLHMASITESSMTNSVKSRSMKGHSSEKRPAKGLTCYSLVSLFGNSFSPWNRSASKSSKSAIVSIISLPMTGI